MPHPLRLYGYPRSSSSWRVRIALHLKGLDWGAIEVDVSRDARAQDEPAYGEVNPMRQVPVLEWSDDAGTHRLTQSVAILEYLDERYPTPPLRPADPLARARMREMVEVINAGTQPLQNNRIMAQVAALGGDAREWAAHHIERGLLALEAMARVRAGQYLLGDQLTVADLFLVPQVFNARLRGVDLTAMPTLTRVEQACMGQAAFAQTHPERAD